MVGEKKGNVVSGTKNHEDMKEALNALEPERKTSETARVIEMCLPFIRPALERGVSHEQIFGVLKKHKALTIRLSTFRQYMKKYGVRKKSDE